MKFLFVLRDSEVDYGTIMEGWIKKQGGEVTTVTNIEEAQTLLQDDQFRVDEIITGSFGNLEDGPWKNVQKAATERDMGVTLFTAYPISDSQKEVFGLQNVRILEKRNIDRETFIAERFPTAGRTEAR